MPIDLKTQPFPAGRVDYLQYPRGEVARDLERCGSMMWRMGGFQARRGIKPNISFRQRGQVREQFRLQGLCGAEDVCRRRGVRYTDGNVRMQAMPDPARLHLMDLLYAGHVLGGMMDFIDDAGLDTIEHAREDGFRRLPDDRKDR